MAKEAGPIKQHGKRSPSRPTTDRDWSRFERSLTQCLGLLRPTEFLILAQRQGYHYVQFAAHEDGGFRAEARSNAYIEGPEPKLDRDACAELLALGWNPPTDIPPELRPPGAPKDTGSPNFYLDQRPRARRSTLARLAVQTLREVYGTNHPSELEYEAFHRDGERIRLPLAFTEPAAPRTEPNLTGAPLMLEAAHAAFPSARLDVGKEGVVIETEAGPLSVAPQADGVLGIWAPVWGAPDPAPEVYEALNVANIWLDGAKVVAVRGELFLVMELLPGWISREALQHALVSAARQVAVARERVLRTLADMQFAGAEEHGAVPVWDGAATTIH